jgi:hypothetical protein
MNLQEVTNILLSSACEDSFGLYEAIWELNGKFPDESLGEKYDVATAALLDLFDQGWITLERVKEGQERDALSPEVVKGLLSNPVSWYPEYEGTSICFVATEAGRSRYFGTSAS